MLLEIILAGFLATIIMSMWTIFIPFRQLLRQIKPNNSLALCSAWTYYLATLVASIIYSPALFFIICTGRTNRFIGYLLLEVDKK